jgi:ribonuclease HII
MAYLIGTDEAGYGPNLGPLVITATVWQVPESLRDCDLYDTLADTVVKAGRVDDPLAIPIADSKQLYKPRGGLAQLERGVLSVLAATGQRCHDWRDVWRCLAPESKPWLEHIPWYASYNRTIPCDVDASEIDRLALSFGEALQGANVSCQVIRSVAIFPERWNDLLDRHESKGTVLALETLSLIARTIEHLEPAPVLIHCDKFGGRNHYAHLLQTVFSECLLQVVRESRAESAYRWGPPESRVECRFTAKGESFLPAALASMASKYLRELAMQAFNDYWIAEHPGLKPTAGYPADARRFRRDIQETQQRLGINERVLWRRK